MKKMKLMFGVLALALLVPTFGYSQSQANVIDKYFQQYVDSEDFTVVYISGKLFEMIGRLDIDKESLSIEDDADMEAIMDIAREMKGLRILTTDKNPEKYYQEAKAKINTKEYEVLMTVRSPDGDNVEFLVQENKETKKISELLLLSGGDEFVLLSFVGNLDMEKIVRLAKEMDNN
jgi:hypothetical protein